MGSQDILKLKYKQAFAFIGTIGGLKEPMEKMSEDPRDQVEVNQIFYVKDDSRDQEDEYYMEQPKFVESKKVFEGQGHFIDSIDYLIPQNQYFMTLDDKITWIQDQMKIFRVTKPPENTPKSYPPT